MVQVELECSPGKEEIGEEEEVGEGKENEDENPVSESEDVDLPSSAHFNPGNFGIHSIKERPDLIK